MAAEVEAKRAGVAAAEAAPNAAADAMPNGIAAEAGAAAEVLAGSGVLTARGNREEPGVLPVVLAGGVDGAVEKLKAGKAGAAGWAAEDAGADTPKNGAELDAPAYADTSGKECVQECKVKHPCRW